jgi:hypothetical protein
MIFWVDKDGVIGTRRDTGFAADALRFVEVDNAVRARVHRCRGTRVGARWVFALITAGDLKGTPDVGKHADVGIFHVRAIHRYRHLVLGFAGCATGMTADALGVINHLGPLYSVTFGSG